MTRRWAWPASSSQRARRRAAASTSRRHQRRRRTAPTTSTTAARPPARPRAAALRPDARQGDARRRWALLGLKRTANLATTDLIFLGYPDGRLDDIAQPRTPAGRTTRPGSTARTPTTSTATSPTCNGDFRYLLSGQHSQLTAAGLRADLDSLLAAHAAERHLHARRLRRAHRPRRGLQAADRRRRRAQRSPVRVHSTLDPSRGRRRTAMELSAARWPNPALANNNPFARFTPTLDFTAPPAPLCDPDADAARAGARWARRTRSSSCRPTCRRRRRPRT